ncbi:MAG TPA: LLM class F420-dependent oxidoreductase [Egibacteraceae bacterium]|nr:LLM class F420-dependent oxidoreductase [Egibacteraceae bacterium]
MTLALSLPITGMPLDETVAYVRDCAELGYRAVWGSEVAGPDFATLLGAVAGAGLDVDLGVAVIPVQTRSPWLIAATAASLAQMSGGRFSLGLGTSSELIAGQWSGAPFDKPLTHLRETVETVRAILAGERANVDGEYVRTHGYKLFAPTPPVPIIVGALNAASLRQAGRIGDGVALNQSAPEHLPMILGEVRKGAEEAGKDFAAMPVVSRIFCMVTDQPAAGREMVRHIFAPYAATSVYNRFFRWLGFTEEMEAVAEAFGRKDRAAAAAALSDRFVESIYVIGDADHVAQRVKDYVDNGVTVAAIQPLAAGRDDALRTMKAIAEAYGL